MPEVSSTKKYQCKKPSNFAAVGLGHNTLATSNNTNPSNEQLINSYQEQNDSPEQPTVDNNTTCIAQKNKDLLNELLETHTKNDNKPLRSSFLNEKNILMDSAISRKNLTNCTK